MKYTHIPIHIHTYFYILCGHHLCPALFIAGLFGIIFSVRFPRQMPKVVKLAKRVIRDNNLDGDVFLCSEAGRGKSYGGFPWPWWYPNSWKVYKGKYY